MLGQGLMPLNPADRGAAGVGVSPQPPRGIGVLDKQEGRTIGGTERLQAEVRGTRACDRCRLLGTLCSDSSNTAAVAGRTAKARLLMDNPEGANRCRWPLRHNRVRVQPL